jgi:hypothetical protein
MKKIISIIIACSLILSACSKNNELPINRTVEVVHQEDTDNSELVDNDIEDKQSLAPEPPKPTPSPTPAPTKTPEPSLTPAPSPTARPSASKSPEPTKRPSPTVKVTASATKSSVPTKIPTSKPSVKPSATATPKPSPTPEQKKTDKYSYFRIACVVVAVIVALILVVKLVKRCKKGEISTSSEGYGEENVFDYDGSGEILDGNYIVCPNTNKKGRRRSIYEILSDKRKQAPSRPSNPEPAPAPEIDPDVARLSTMVLSKTNYNVRIALRLVIRIAFKSKLNQLSDYVQNSLLQDCEIMLDPDVINNDFKIGVKAINALGHLEEVRDRVEDACTRRNLDLDAILAEQP